MHGTDATPVAAAEAVAAVSDAQTQEDMSYLAESPREQWLDKIVLGGDCRRIRRAASVERSPVMRPAGPHEQQPGGREARRTGQRGAGAPLRRAGPPR